MKKLTMLVLGVLLVGFVACSQKQVDTENTGAVIQAADSTAVVDSTQVTQ